MFQGSHTMIRKSLLELLAVAPSALVLGPCNYLACVTNLEFGQTVYDFGICNPKAELQRCPLGHCVWDIHQSPVP